MSVPFPRQLPPPLSPKLLSSRAPRFCKLTLPAITSISLLRRRPAAPLPRGTPHRPHNFKLLPRMPLPSTLQSHRTATLSQCVSLRGFLSEVPTSAFLAQTP